MKKMITLVLSLVVIVVIVVTISKVGQPKNYTAANRIGVMKSINYTSLNVREKPKGEIIGSLDFNSTVTLTGNYCSYFLENEEFGLWAEIEYKGKTAWITARALR